MQHLTHRPATPADAPALVDFVLMAGEGLPEMAWADLARQDETWRDVGLRRAARDAGAFSWRNATLFKRAETVVAGLVGYALPVQPQPIGPDVPSAFVSLQELENLACATWYVNILAVVAGARGQGIGAAMLSHAEGVAREADLRGVSIIVFSDNTGAERLYRRSGYGEIARRRMTLPGWAHDGCDAILLVKSV